MLPLVGLAGPLFVFAAIAVLVFLAILFGLPDDTKPRHGRRAGHGAPMSYPSLASSPTGASIIAATSPKMKRLKWNDPRIRRLDYCRASSPVMPKRRRLPASAFS